MSNQPIKNQEYSFYVFLVSQSTGQFQSNPTIAAGDFKRSIDGAAYANFTNLPVVDPSGNRSVKITFTSTEMNSSNLLWYASDAAGAEWDEVGGDIKPISWLDTNDDVTGLAANTVTASAISSDAVIEIQSGLATSAALATVQADTDNIQTRLPNTLSGDGFMKSDLKSIEDELTSGNNAILRLKQLDIQNQTDFPVNISTSQAGNIAINVNSDGVNGIGAYILGSVAGIAFEAVNGSGATFSGGGSGHGIDSIASSGKSINAPNNITISDGDLTLTNIAKKVLTLDWTTVTGEAARSVLNALRKLRNKVSFNGSATLTVYKEDGTTSAYTQTVTTDDAQEPFKELG